MNISNNSMKSITSVLFLFSISLLLLTGCLSLITLDYRDYRGLTPFYFYISRHNLLIED